MAIVITGDLYIPLGFGTIRLSNFSGDSLFPRVGGEGHTRSLRWTWVVLPSKPCGELSLQVLTVSVTEGSIQIHITCDHMKGNRYIDYLLWELGLYAQDYITCTTWQFSIHPLLSPL